MLLISIILVTILPSEIIFSQYLLKMAVNELSVTGFEKSLPLHQGIKANNAQIRIAWYNKKGIVVLLHSLAWILICALPFLIRTSNNDSHKPPFEIGFLYFYIATRPFWIGLFYLNAFYLFPKFIPQKKYTFFVVTQLLGLFLLSVIHSIGLNVFLKPTSYEIANFLTYNSIYYLFILASSIAYRLIIDKIASDKLLQERENENLKTELSFLRSQVSPHFMFNVLNNMVALARKKSEQLEPSLIKLSSLMRYMLYETDEQKVPLEKEVEYLQSYIDLQKQRFGKNVTTHTCFSESDGNYSIEPMLLIPFVENAFKHGTGLIEHAEINIELKAKNDVLHFTVRNKYNHQSEEQKDKTSGIGMSNVERRLNLLYAKNHSLLITNKDGWFTISLQLNLH
jgi:two-component system, LytTR family, sensor kinase